VTRRLLAGYLLVTVLVLAALEIPLGVTNARNEREDLTAKVEHDTVVLASIAQAPLAHPSAATIAPLQALVARYGQTTSGRALVVGRRGIAVADSAPRPGESRDFSSRPEIHAALNGRIVSGTRFSRTLGTNLLYVAAPVASSGTIRGAVRITYPTSAVDARVRRYWLILAAIAGIVLAGAAVVGIALARSIVRPLRWLEQAASAAGAGDLTARAPVEGPPEVRSLAVAFNDTAAKLATLLRSQDEFVADASHQLRTPLTALRLRLENLEADVSAEGRADLEGALAEVERLAQLVDALLALSRAEAERPAPGELDVAELADGRVEAWAPLAAERGVGLVAARPDGPLRAIGAAERLEQVLDNLLENALDVSPRGTSIQLAMWRADGFVELHVADEGPGLSEAERARAFDRFWRGRSGGEGSGLGLAIARRLVEADGGDLELAESDSGGVDAVVRLRAAR
jgi:signal transduction histidine kinase